MATKLELKELYERKNQIAKACDSACLAKTGFNLLDFGIEVEANTEPFEEAVFGLNEENAKSLFFAIFQRRKSIADQEMANPLLLEQKALLTEIRKTLTIKVKAQKDVKNSLDSQLDLLNDVFQAEMEMDSFINMYSNSQDIALNYLKLHIDYRKADRKVSELDKDRQTNELVNIYSGNIITIREFYKVCFSFLGVLRNAVYSRLLDLQALKNLDTRKQSHRAIETQIKNKEKQAYKRLNIKKQDELVAKINDAISFKF